MHKLNIRAGIPVAEALENVQREDRVEIAIRVTGGKHNQDYKELLQNWEAGMTADPPTWVILHELLRELGLEELSQQIEDYLSCE